MGRMGINILLREEMGMFLYTTMKMGWGWEYGRGNRRKWKRKSHSRTSLMHVILWVAYDPIL